VTYSTAMTYAKSLSPVIPIMDRLYAAYSGLNTEERPLKTEQTRVFVLNAVSDHAVARVARGDGLVKALLQCRSDDS
jgi:hypothetical protein